MFTPEWLRAASSTRLEYEYFGKFGTNNGATSNGNASNWGLRAQYKF